jgi:hypothetical protein
MLPRVARSLARKPAWRLSGIGSRARAPPRGTRRNGRGHTSARRGRTRACRLFKGRYCWVRYCEHRRTVKDKGPPRPASNPPKGKPSMHLPAATLVRPAPPWPASRRRARPDPPRHHRAGLDSALQGRPVRRRDQARRVDRGHRRRHDRQSRTRPSGRRRSTRTSSSISSSRTTRTATAASSCTRPTPGDWIPELRRNPDCRRPRQVGPGKPHFPLRRHLRPPRRLEVPRQARRASGTATPSPASTGRSGSCSTANS